MVDKTKCLNFPLNFETEFWAQLLSIVRLISSLTGHLVKCFMTLLPKMLIFLLKKNERSFCTAKASDIFSTKKKYLGISEMNVGNFKETFSFEQPGPVLCRLVCKCTVSHALLSVYLRFTYYIRSRDHMVAVFIL